MQIKTNLTNELYQYALKYGVHEHPLLSQLRQETAQLSNAHMQISPDQGQFMGLLAKITGAQKYLEIGVFTGYSSLVMALSMGKTGQVFALDNDPHVIAIAKKYWQQALVEQQITCLLAPALNSLASLTTHHLASFDIAFIDANKADYLNYYEYCYSLVKPGGLILIDNTLFQAQVLENNPPQKVQAIQKLNQFIYTDKRVEFSLLPIADGLTIVYKKKDNQA